MIDEYILAKNHEQLVSDKLLSLLESIGTIQNMRENTYLFYQGKVAKKIYLIKSGIVRISMTSSQGTEMTLRVCQKNDIVGELTLYCDNPNYLLNAKIIEAGRVIAVSIDTLHEKLKSNHELAIEIMKWTNNHMRKYQMKMKDLLLNGKIGALYTTLIRLSNSYGLKKANGILIDHVLTDQNLANFCGATREYVNRMLRDLRKKDVVCVTDDGKIFIKDLDYLKRKGHCEDCPIEICNIN